MKKNCDQIINILRSKRFDIISINFWGGRINAEFRKGNKTVFLEGSCFSPNVLVRIPWKRDREIIN